MERVLDFDWLARWREVVQLELLERLERLGRHGCFVAVHRRDTWFGRLVGETRGEIP